MNKPIFTAIALLTGIVIVGALIYTYQTRPLPPQFSYDGSSMDGWWGSDNMNVQDVAGSNYQGNQPKDRLPVADLTVHHGDKDGTDVPEDNCFVMFSYFDFPLGSVDAAYKNYEDQKHEQGSLEELEPLKQRLATFEGEKEFDLKQYSFTIEDSDALAGYQVGFVPLSNGYLRTEGVCKTADDLALTLPAFEAVELLER